MLRISVVCLIVLSAGGCKSTENVNSSSTSNDKSELEEIYWEQIESDNMQFSQADVDFMIGMIGHHAQAIIMSRLAPTHTQNEQIQTLAARIINTQKAEIKAMQRWLRLREQPVPKVEIHGLHLMISGVKGHGDHSGHMNMPGMLTQEQLQNLANAKGPEFNRLFLNYMIEHHQGAVTMVETLFNTPSGAVEDNVFKLASGINAEQQTEIARMKRMLDDLAAAQQNRNSR